MILKWAFPAWWNTPSRGRWISTSYMSLSTCLEHPKFAEPDQAFLAKVRRHLKKINLALNDEDFIDLRASHYRYAQPICDPSYLDKPPPVALPVKGLWDADTSYYYPKDRAYPKILALGKRWPRKQLDD
jgi:protoporphyrinogen oxidase